MLETRAESFLCDSRLLAVAAHPNGAAAEKALDGAVREMARVAALLDLRDPASPASVFFAGKKREGLCEDLEDALAQAQSIQQALGDALVGNVRRTEGFMLEGMAAGYVLDAGALFLQKQGIRGALLGFRGAFRALGNRRGGRPWEVEAIHLTKDRPALAVLPAEDAKWFAPAASMPGGRIAVLGPNAACARALAHAAISSGSGRVMDLAGRMAGVECRTLAGKGTCRLSL
ncbi:MAG: FAD:protein FMN transferase [Thermodesulfobacteriota bacterium]